MANEKRLVNAEAIARKLKNANCAECNVVRKIQCSACWVNDVLELLDGDSVDAVEFDHAVLVSVQIALESIRQYRRIVGHDPVFDFSQKELNELADYARYLLGGNMDGGNEDG